MSLTIKRKQDNRVVKCLLHRVADIPGGVTVSSANLGGDVLQEGTPIGVGSNGVYTVAKTAKVVTAATNSATSYEVAKGHHFKVGDYFAAGSANGQKIATVDKSNADKDIITVDTTLGAAIAAGTVAYQTTAANKTASVNAVAVVGSSADVEAGNNLFVDAWVLGVVREGNAPAATDAIKTALKGIVYI